MTQTMPDLPALRVPYRMAFVCVIALFVMFGTTGCATLTQSNHQVVRIATVPAEAFVTIQGEGENRLSGITPFPAKLARNHEYVVTIRKEGYRQVQIHITRRFSGLSLFGNLLWLPIGIVVDLASGSAYDLEPTRIDVVLTRK